ncbi:MAG: trypco2 family protein [Cyanobacteria bacterium P01_C01_bin.70]
MTQPIGLSELINQVKKELLTPPDKDGEPPVFFVDAVELELQVTAKREGNAGIKIDVVSIGGGEAGGTLSQEKTHTVKVSLSPLFEKEQLVEWFKDVRGEQVMPAVDGSLDALIKGKDDNLADRF